MRGSPEVFSNFKAGVNLQAAPYSLDIDQARDALNVHTSPSGAIVKRNGCSIQAEPSVALQSLFGCRVATPVLLGQGGTKFYKISTSASTVTELETEVTPTEGLAWEFIQAPLKETKGPIFGVNGTNTNVYWDGSTGKLKKWEGSGVPKGKYIIYHENRVYIASGSKLYWSDIINPFNFESPNGGSTELDPEDGQEITGLGKVGSYLLIFKDRKTFLLTDSNNGYYRRISSQIGCGSNRSIVETEQGTFFLDSDSRIVVTDGSSFNYEVGENIEPILYGVVGSNRAKVCGTFSNGYVYFSFPRSGGVNDTILEYDLLNTSWWIHRLSYATGTTGGVNQFVQLDVGKESKLYAAGSSSTKKVVFNCFVEGRFLDGVMYPAEWKSPWLVFGAPHVNKRIRTVRVDALGEYEFYAYKTFAGASEKEDVVYWESSSEEGKWESTSPYKWEEGLAEEKWGGEVAVSERRYPSIGVGRAWSFRFYGETATDLEIYAYTVSALLRKD